MKDRNRKAAAVQREREAERAAELLDLTVAAWVTAVGVRVKDLANVLGRLTYLHGHPDEGPGAAVLASVLDLDALGRLAGAIDEAEQQLDKLLPADYSAPVPDLAGACRSAAKALAASAKEK